MVGSGAGGALHGVAAVLGVAVGFVRGRGLGDVRAAVVTEVEVERRRLRVRSAGRREVQCGADGSGMKTLGQCGCGCEALLRAIFPVIHLLMAAVGTHWFWLTWPRQESAEFEAQRRLRGRRGEEGGS